MNHFLIRYFAQKARELEGERVSSIVFPSEQEFAIGFKGRYIYINLSTQNPSLVVTSFDFDSIKTSNSFFSLVRNRFHHLILDKVLQRGLERIVTFRFVDRRGNMVRNFDLVVELLDRATNAIVVGEDGAVIHAYKMKRLSGVKKYIPSVSRMPDMLVEDVETLKETYLKGGNILGMSGALRRMIRTPEDFVKVVEAVRKAFAGSGQRLYLYGGKEIYPFFVDMGVEVTPVRECDVEKMIILKPRETSFKQRKGQIVSAMRRRISSLRHRLEKIDKDLEKVEKSEYLRIYAENLMSHPNVSVDADGYVRCLDVYTGVELNIPVDRSKSIFENADQYFKKYRKLKRSKEVILKRREETLRELEYISQLLFDVEHSGTLSDLASIEALLIEEGFIHTPLKIRHDKAVPYDRLNIHGFDVFVGKNARGNDYLISKVATGDDLWFHPHERPGPHLILKNPNRLKSFDDDVILECAKEVARRLKTGDKVDIDFTFVRYVKKPRGLKPGMVIYSNFKTVRVDLCM